MGSFPNPSPTDPDKREWFATTHWSVVVAAGQGGSQMADAALEALCRTYWLPLYSYIRRRGHPPHDAVDLTQGFFAALLERNDFAVANRERGRFRSFLLGSLNHYLANEHDRANAAKRGGGRTIISLDDESIENRYRLEPFTEVSPDLLFDQRWALAVMEQALGSLQTELSAKGKERHFTILKEFLTQEPEGGEYQRAAEMLGVTEGAVAVAVHRLRQRYREMVRLTVAQTVASPLEVDDEMRHLLRLLQGR